MHNTGIYTCFHRGQKPGTVSFQAYRHYKIQNAKTVTHTFTYAASLFKS